MTGISAIVATYKRSHQLKNLFDSLVSNHCDCLEVIIVDQNKDGLIDNLISEYSQHLTIEHLKIDVPNQSLARNAGAVRAKYPIICFPDDDCWFDNDSIAKILNDFERDKELELLIINWRQNPATNNESMALTKEKIFSYKAPATYSTYVLFFKRNVFFKLGCFMETIGLGRYIGGGEDTELIFRAAKHNFKMYYDADIFVNHNHTATVERNLQSIRSRQRGTGYIYSKYKLSYFVILRGFSSPFLKMITCMNFRNAQAHYNTFMARLEGFMYGMKENKMS